MTMFALFEFFEENSIDVGQWNWVDDHGIIDRESLSKDTEVIVQWPTNPKVLKSLGKKSLPVDSERKDCAAYVLKTSDNLQGLRQLANDVSKGSDSSLLSPNPDKKRSRKKNLKYLDENCDEEEITKTVAPRKKGKTNQCATQDLQLSRQIEHDLNLKLNAMKGATKSLEGIQSSGDEEDFYEEMMSLKKRNRILEKENKHLTQMLQNQKGINDVMEAVQRIEQRLENGGTLLSGKTPGRSSPLPTRSPMQKPLSPLTTSRTPIAPRYQITPAVVSRSPLASVDINQLECKMITLWEGVEIPEGKWKLLDSKKDNVREFTNSLVRMLYDSNVLASSSLTGKISNAFKASKTPKAKLPDVDNVISFISSRTADDGKKVKAAITQLLNTEAKRGKDSGDQQNAD